MAVFKMSSSVGEGNTLSHLDWGIFAGTLAGIACLGSFAGRNTTSKKDGGHGSKSEYVFGTGGKGGFATMASSMPTMMLSFARGTTGVRAFIGFPAELYYWGVGMWEIIYGVILSFPIIAFVFIPVYYDLGVTSVYQYLELRFRSKAARRLASGTYAIRSIIMLGVTMLTPSIALSGLAGLPLWVCILIIGALTICGCVSGGLRGVVIIDALQGLLLCATCLFIAGLGCYHGGGFVKAFQISRERGRLDFFNFDLDPTLRISTVTAIVGQLGMSVAVMGCQQNFAQRYSSMPTKKSVIVSLLGNIPLTTLTFSMPWFAGIGIFAALADCDPYQAGMTDRYDGVVTYFVNKYFSGFPGLTGFFLAIICNSGLNILISNLNAIGTVIWEDFFSQTPCFKNVKASHQVFVIKGIAILSSLIIVGFAFGCALLPGITETSMITNSATSGALLGMFVLAILFPCANGKGVVVGAVAGHILSFWVAIGGLLADTTGVKTKVDPLPTSIAGCNDSITFGNNDSSEHATLLVMQMMRNYSTDSLTYYDVPSISDTAGNTNANFLTSLYAMTYMYYNLFGCVITVVVGLIVSLCTGNIEDDIYEERMVHPKAIKISKMLPGKARTFATPYSTFKSEGRTKSKSKDEVIGSEMNARGRELGVVNGGLDIDEKIH